MAVLGGYEVVHPDIEIRGDADPGEKPGSESTFPDASTGLDDRVEKVDSDPGFDPGLLRRLQSDLFHRRAAPGFPLRGAVDKADPSLQVHACHTRLRELQVLHAQLRALFERPEARRGGKKWVSTVSS